MTMAKLYLVPCLCQCLSALHVTINMTLRTVCVFFIIEVEWTVNRNDLLSEKKVLLTSNGSETWNVKEFKDICDTVICTKGQISLSFHWEIHTDETQEDVIYWLSKSAWNHWSSDFLEVTWSVPRTLIADVEIVQNLKYFFI